MSERPEDRERRFRKQADIIRLLEPLLVPLLSHQLADKSREETGKVRILNLFVPASAGKRQAASASSTDAVSYETDLGTIAITSTWRSADRDAEDWVMRIAWNGRLRGVTEMLVEFVDPSTNEPITDSISLGSNLDADEVHLSEAELGFDPTARAWGMRPLLVLKG